MEKLIIKEPANIQANINIVNKEVDISSSNKIKSKTRVKREIEMDSTINLPIKLKDFVLPHDKYKAIPCSKPNNIAKGNIMNSK